MNMNDYRRAMDRVVPNNELKERIMNQPKKKYTPIRRVFTLALAAALTATCLATAAFAASPALRTAVLSFFHMEEREQVPNSGAAPEGPDISQAEIGQLVKAQYIKMEQNTFGRGYNYLAGLFADLEWSEDCRTLLSAEFVEIQNGELAPVQVEMNTNRIDIDYDGIHYQGELYWFVRDGALHFFKGEPYGVDTRPEDQWYVQTIPGRTDAVLLNLAQGRQMDYTEYPVLYHLDTGETEDILKESGLDNLGQLNSFVWSEDMTKVLVMRNNGEGDRQTWLYNLESKNLSELEQLTGTQAEIASFADNDTLVLFEFSKDEEGYIKSAAGYVYQISAGRLEKTLEQTPCFRRWEDDPYGIMYYGPSCLFISQAGQVKIFNVVTGEQTILEGFTCQVNQDKFMPSSFGDKLLYFSMDPETEGLGITQIGVVDLEKRTFIAFDREGYENLHEEAIGWSDNNTVSINARTPDGETQYLILYQF